MPIVLRARRRQHADSVRDHLIVHELDLIYILDPMNWKLKHKQTDRLRLMDKMNWPCWYAFLSHKTLQSESLNNNNFESWDNTLLTQQFRTLSLSNKQTQFKLFSFNLSSWWYERKVTSLKVLSFLWKFFGLMSLQVRDILNARCQAWWVQELKISESFPAVFGWPWKFVR